MSDLEDRLTPVDTTLALGQQAVSRWEHTRSNMALEDRLTPVDPATGNDLPASIDPWGSFQQKRRQMDYQNLMQLAGVGNETNPDRRAEEEAKIQVSLYLSDRMKLNPRDVYLSWDGAGHSPFAEVYFKAVDRPISYKQQIVNEVTRAAKTYQALNIAGGIMRSWSTVPSYADPNSVLGGYISSRSRFSTDTLDQLKKLQEVLDSIPKEQGPPARKLGQGGLWDFFKSIPLATIQQAPYLLDMGLAEVVGAAVGGGIAAFAGPEAVPAGVAIGRKAAGMIEGTRVGANMIFMDILTMPDPETGEPLYKVVRDPGALASIASASAAIFGGVTGGLQVLGFEALLGRGAVDAAIQRIATGAVEKAGKSGAIRNVFTTFLAKYGKNVGAQTLIMPVQEVVNQIARDTAAEAINGKIGMELPKANWQDYVRLAGQAAETAFKGSLLFALPGSIKEARAAVGEAFREVGVKEASRKIEALDNMSDQQRAPEERMTDITGRLEELKAAQKKLEMQNPQLLDLSQVKGIDKKLGDLIKEHQRNQTETQYLDLLRMETESALPQPWKQTREEWQRSTPRSETTAVETPAAMMIESPLVEQIRTGLLGLQGSKERAQGSALYLKLHTDTLGMSPEDYMSSRFVKDIFDPSMAAELEKQGRLGAIRWNEAGKAILMTTTHSNFTTWVHELNHQFARDLTAEERTAAERWLGVKPGTPWSTQQQEMFANAGLAYLMSGRSPQQELQPVFQRFAGWIDEVYHSVKDQWPVTEDIRKTYEGILAGKRKAEVPAQAEVSPYLRQFFQTPAMHGTAFDFEKFSLERAGTGEGTGAFGQGVYLTSKEGVARYYADYVARRRAGPSRQVLKTEIGKDNFLSWYDGPTDAQRKQILEGAIKERTFADRENKGYLVERFKQAVKDGSGEEIYRYLSIALGDEKAASAFLQRSGIDGFNYPVGTLTGGNVAKSPERGQNYVVFDPGNISIKARTLFQTPPVAEGDRTYEGWRLKSEDVIRAKMTGPMPAESARKMLLNAGVSPEEMKWMGLDDALAKGGKITPEQLLQAIRENGIQVVEVVKGDSSQRDLDQAEAEFMRIATRDGVDPGDARDIGLDAARRQLTPQQQDLLTPEARAALDEVRRGYQRRGEGPVGEQTKYAQYTLPGGEAYRELLLRIPAPARAGDIGTFQSPHWKESNVLAHVRFDDRVDAQGARTLFIEELQSDWHQAGREKGYLAGAKYEEGRDLWIALDSSGQPITGFDGDPFQFFAVPGEITEADALIEFRERAARGETKIIPAAPFSKSWPELSFKRMLRWAAENEYDELAWTTGEQQAARYDLSKQVDGVTIQKQEDGSFTVFADRKGETIFVQEERDAGEFAGIIGKDLAAKAVALEAGQEERFTGKNLVVGGAGMRGFYDRIVVELANKIGKKWGVKAGETKTLTNPAEGGGTPVHGAEYATVHSLPINDEMREGVKQGLYLFQTPPKVTDTLDQRRLNTAMGDFWGFTEDPQEGAFILSTGQMLDFMHKKIGQAETVMEGGRPVHRQIALPFMQLFKTGQVNQEFMDRAGAIRMNYDQQSTVINSVRQPSEEQIARIASILPKTRAVDLEVTGKDGTPLGYKRVESPSIDQVRAFYRAFDMYNPAGILAQPSPHEEAVQRAVKIGHPVPQKVLEQYQTQSWARQEISRRTALVEEARKAVSYDEFADWMARADIESSGNDQYYRMIWEAAKRPEDPDVQTSRFVAAMDDSTIKDVLAEIEFTEGDLGTARVQALTPEMRELAKKLLKNEQDDTLLATVKGQIQGDADRWRRVLMVENPDNPSRAASAIQTAEAAATQDFTPITPRQANVRFIQMMDKGGLAGFAGDLYTAQLGKMHEAGLTKSQKFSLPRWLAVLGKQAREGAPSELTERMAMREVRQDPSYYRQLFAGFYHEEEMIRQLQHEETLELSPEDKVLQVENAKLRADLLRWKKRVKEVAAGNWDAATSDTIAELNTQIEQRGKLTAALEMDLIAEQAKANDLANQLLKHHDSTVEKNYQAQVQKLEGMLVKQTAVNSNMALIQWRRSQMEKLIREINRPMDPYVADAEARMIEDIQSRITYDPADAQGGMLNRLKEWRRQNPDAEMPPDLVMQIETRSARAMSFAELEQIASRVRELRTQGRHKRMDELAAERGLVVTQQGSAIVELRKGEAPADVKGLGTAGARKAFKTGVVKKTLWATWRMNRLADMMGPTFTRWLWDEVNDKTDATLVEIRKVDKAATEKLKTLGIGPRELGRQEVIDGMKFSRAEMIGVYIYSQTEKSYAAIRWGNKISDEAIRAAIQKLTPQEKEYADWMVSTLSSDADFDRLQAAQIEFNNTRMERVGRYFPMQRRGLAGGQFLSDIAQELLEMRGYSRRPRPRSSFLISRIDIAPENQTPIRLDAPSVFHDHVNKREFFINNAQLIKRLTRIFDNREVNRALLDRYGHAMPELISKYIGAYTNPNIYRAVEDWGNFGRILRANYGLSLIGSNLMTILRQVPDIPMIMIQAGPIEGLVAAAQFARNPAKAIRDVQEKAPQLQLRSYDRVIEEMKLLDKTSYERVVRKVGEAGFAALKAMDITTNTIGWLAAYNKAMKQTGNEQASVKAARDFILAKRPAARAKDLAQLWRQPGIMSWLTLFTNQPNQQWNVLTYDIPRKLASGLRGNWQDLGEAVMNATALMIGAVGMGMIARKSIGNIRDWGKDTIAGIVGNVPFIGYDMENAIRGQASRGGFQPISGPYEVAKAVTDIVEGAEQEKVVREIMNAIWAISQTAGLPAIQMRRFYKTAVTGDPWELVGGAPKGE